MLYRVLRRELYPIPNCNCISLISPSVLIRIYLTALYKSLSRTLSMVMNVQVVSRLFPSPLSAFTLQIDRLLNNNGIIYCIMF